MDLIEVTDDWDADLCAIGLKKNNKRIYIQTFYHLNMNPILYDFDLEIIDDAKEDKINVVKEGRGVSFEELKIEIRN